MWLPRDLFANISGRTVLIKLPRRFLSLSLVDYSLCIGNTTILSHYLYEIASGPYFTQSQIRLPGEFNQREGESHLLKCGVNHAFYYLLM